MKIMLVINAYTDACLHQACQLGTFLRKNGIAVEDAAAVGFGPAGREELLLEGFRMLPVNDGIIVRSPFYAPKEMLAWLEAHLTRPEICLFPGDGFGQELAVMAAARWKGSSLTGVTALDPDAGRAKKPFYAGYLAGWFCLQARPYVMSIDPGLAAEPLPPAVHPQGEESLSPTVCPQDGDSLSPAVLTAEKKSSSLGNSGGRQHRIIRQYDLPVGELQEAVVRRAPETKNGLQEAARVVICGMGIGNKRNAEEIRALAKEVSFVVGASRPAVMNAWFPADRLIGVSGAMIAPEVCILLGVSGAPAFYSGIRHAGKIIAVNQDREAPIMKKADLAIVGDCMDVFRSFVRQADENVLQETPS